MSRHCTEGNVCALHINDLLNECVRPVENIGTPFQMEVQTNAALGVPQISLADEEDPSPAVGESCGEDQYGPFSGQVISAARESIRNAVLKGEPRLVVGKQVFVHFIVCIELLFHHIISHVKIF